MHIAIYKLLCYNAKSGDKLSFVEGSSKVNNYSTRLQTHKTHLMHFGKLHEHLHCVNTLFDNT